ncbi:MAG: DNA-directed RNA polymerase subunit beta [Parcubacteria group bacterium GW2011_GWA2_50_10]|nr:MAG: DNA-directed RNA polymerase subunit beta [Parcubacteria group bacterium GW2011_GWA2_50_10]
MASSTLQIKDFRKSAIHLELPYLLNVQHESWNLFWARQLKELLSEISPIRDYTKKEFELWFLDYKLGEPNYPTELAAKKNDDSLTKMKLHEWTFGSEKPWQDQKDAKIRQCSHDVMRLNIILVMR